MRGIRFWMTASNECVIFASVFPVAVFCLWWCLLSFPMQKHYPSSDWYDPWLQIKKTCLKFKHSSMKICGSFQRYHSSWDGRLISYSSSPYTLHHESEITFCFDKGFICSNRDAFVQMMGIIHLGILTNSLLDHRLISFLIRIQRFLLIMKKICFIRDLRMRKNAAKMLSKSTGDQLSQMVTSFFSSVSNWVNQ